MNLECRSKAGRSERNPKNHRGIRREGGSLQKPFSREFLRQWVHEQAMEESAAATCCSAVLLAPAYSEGHRDRIAV